MHNTFTECKQFHNNIMKWQLNTYLYFFHGKTSSWAFSFIIFFIHNNIISYPNVNMDKSFFKSWVLCIHHHLRDIIWIVRAWYSVAPIFSFSYYEPSFILCVLFLESIESNHFLLEHIPRMNESHDPGRPFNMVITILRWIRGYSRIEFFIFPLIWEILFELWDIDLQLIPSSFILLWVELLLVCTLPRVC